MQIQHRYIALVIAWLPAPVALASAPQVYLASAPAGAANGTSCSNAQGIGFFNDAANWGPGPAQIGPGSTVHLCGVFTAPAGASGYLTFQAGGIVGSPITLVAEPGAILQAPYWGSAGAIQVNGVSNVVLDGRGVGLIQATANGTKLANQAPNCGGSWCTVGIYVLQCDNCTVENWTIGNIYVNVPPADESVTADGSAGILFNGGNNATISGNTFHDAKWCMVYAFPSGVTSNNVRIAGNTAYNCDHGVFVGSDNTGAILNNLYVYGNTIHDGANWDDNADQNHHDGIHLSPSHPNTAINNSYVYNNYIYGDWGFHCTAFIYLAPGTDPGYTMANANVFDNLLVNTSTVNFCGDGLILDFGAQNTLIANNTLIGSTQAAGTGLSLEEVSPFRSVLRNNLFVNLQNGIYVAQGNSLPSSDYNVFFNVPNVAFVWGTSCCTPLSEWRTQAGAPDLHSSTGDPHLSPAYVPQPGGAAALQGVNLTGLGMSALDADIVGVPRPSSGAWDIGAFASGATHTLVTISVNPSAVSLGSSGQQQFAATVSDSTLAVTWSMSPALGTLTNTGLYTAPSSITSAQKVQITAMAGSSSATALVTLNPPVTIAVNPTTKSLGPAGQQQFAATVTGTSAPVIWTMNPKMGTLTAAGMYTAPSSITTAQKVQVTAAVGATSASAVVTLNPQTIVPITVKVTPTATTLGPGGRQRFVATVTGSTAGVTWSLSPVFGSLSSTGLYTAPAGVETKTTVQITAKSKANPAIFATAIVTLTPKSVSAP